MNAVSVKDVGDLLVPLLSVFSPHLMMIFSMMIAFSIAKFTKDIMIN